MAATTESAFTAEGPMDTRADGVPPPAPPTAAVPAVATTAAAPASAPATTSGAAAARTAPAVESKVERRRTAPPIAARKSPRGQKEYTDFMGHCQLALPSRRRDLLTVVGCALETVFSAPGRKTDRLPADARLITAFHSVSVPTMSIQSYFKRLTDYIDCSAECCVMAMVHVNRIHVSKPNFQIDSLTIHRLLLTALLCSSKFFDDHVFNNSQWANIGGVSPREMNNLEREFLILLDYSLFVTTDAYVQVYNELCNPLLHIRCPSSGGTCSATQLYGTHPREATILREGPLALCHEQKTGATAPAAPVGCATVRLLGLAAGHPNPDRRATLPPLSSATSKPTPTRRTQST